jgi:hypothetical protein
MLLGFGSGYKGPEIHPLFSSAVFLPKQVPFVADLPSFLDHTLADFCSHSCKMVQLQTALLGLVGLAALTQAHPGHDVRVEAAERASALKSARGLAHCADTLKARGFEAKNFARRDHAVRQLRRKRSIELSR